jgi:hypothetical protein
MAVSYYDVMPGDRYVFDYPAEWTELPEYSAHRGAMVTVLRRLTEEEADPHIEVDGEVDCEGMFRVRADDGWEGDAWPSEFVLPSERQAVA